jgi:hypothetical protein
MLRVGGFHRRKVVAKDWFANGGDLSVKGKLEMLQQSEYELTNVDVNLKGLVDNSGYHVHVTSVEGDLEFPCESSTLYNHWNPRDVDLKTSPIAASGSTDQYESNFGVDYDNFLFNNTYFFSGRFEWKVWKIGWTQRV